MALLAAVVLSYVVRTYMSHRRVGVTLTFVALALSYTVDMAELDLLVTKEADESTNTMLALPPLFVSVAPWVPTDYPVKSLAISRNCCLWD